MCRLRVLRRKKNFVQSLCLSNAGCLVSLLFPLFAPDRWLAEGETIKIGDEELAVLHTPGHTREHVLFNASSRLALVGDVLFFGSIGRTDFPRGDLPTLLRSIRLKLWPLGDDVRFIPGHGPMSEFGRERRSTPFSLNPLEDTDANRDARG